MFAGRGNVAIIPLFKKNRISGGCVLFENQAAGSFTAKGAYTSVLEGSKWTKPSLTAFNSSILTTYGGGDVKKTISATATRVKFSEKGSGTISINKQTGIVRTSYKHERRTYIGSGAAYF